LAHVYQWYSRCQQVKRIGVSKQHGNIEIIEVFCLFVCHIFFLSFISILILYFYLNSEEVFDFSSGQMTQTKAKHLKESMCNEFQQVFQLCTFIMSNSQNTSLINVTLETLLRFLNWIPLGYIFETELIPHLIETFLVMPLFRNVTLKCLTEIVSINVSTYDEKFVLLYNMTMTRIKEVNLHRWPSFIVYLYF